MKTKNKEMINVENLLLGNQALYRELLYKLARDYEYQGDYQSAIERYKEMVKLGTKEGITEIAKAGGNSDWRNILWFYSAV